LSEAVKGLNPNMDAYCVANGPRPLLSYGAKGTRVGRKTFLFTAALRQWEQLHDKMDLNEAYKRARRNFSGKMEQLFVVLKENYEQPNVSGPNMIPVGAKRRADEPLMNAPKK